MCTFLNHWRDRVEKQTSHLSTTREETGIVHTEVAMVAPDRPAHDRPFFNVLTRQWTGVLRNWYGGHRFIYNACVAFYKHAEDSVIRMADVFVTNDMHLPSLRTLGAVAATGGQPIGAFFSCSHPREWTDAAPGLLEDRGHAVYVVLHRRQYGNGPHANLRLLARPHGHHGRYPRRGHAARSQCVGGRCILRHAPQERQVRPPQVPSKCPPSAII